MKKRPTKCLENGCEAALHVGFALPWFRCSQTVCRWGVFLILQGCCWWPTPANVLPLKKSAHNLILLSLLPKIGLKLMKLQKASIYTGDNQILLRKKLITKKKDFQQEHRLIPWKMASKNVNVLCGAPQVQQIFLMHCVEKSLRSTAIVETIFRNVAQCAIRCISSQSWSCEFNSHMISLLIMQKAFYEDFFFSWLKCLR